MENTFQLQSLLELTIFLSIVFMNIARRNSSLMLAYLVQSSMLVILLGIQALQEDALGIIIVTLILLVVKVIVTPTLLFRLLKQQKLNISVSTYLNIPLTLGVLVLLSIFAQSEVFSSFSGFIPQFRMMLIGSMLMSIFLTINRKGALSQIIGILSLENAIFVFGHFLGTKQSASLEVGILFDVLFWVVISSVFVRMMFKHFGSIDVTGLQKLKK